MDRFRIDLPFDELRTRLASTRWSDPLDDEGGFPLADLLEIVEYWRDGFDWNAQQRALNALPHFKHDGIHFIHIRNARTYATPLILMHGWPGSFVEFLHVIPLLAPAFHLVIPSLPGFAFSEAQADSTNRSIASRFVRLMSALGYERFLAQGGDWGAGVASWMAVDHPQRLLGIHLNYIPGSYEPPPGDPPTEEERAFVAACDRWMDESGAYLRLQRTRPLTLAHALADSPAGLAAWLIEKFREWAAPDSQLALDDLLTNVTIYWATDTIHSSMRLYRESPRTPLRLERRIDVPTAVARFPYEEPFPPRSWVERGYRIERWSELPHGGHFAALEQPQLFADDLRAWR